MSFTFKTFLSDGRQCFLYGEEEKETEQSMLFPESLVQFLDLSYEALNDICHPLGRKLQMIRTDNSPEVLAEIEMGLQQLAAQHIYFSFVRLQWRERLRQAKENGKALPYKEISQLPSEVAEQQRQILYMIQRLFDIDMPGYKKEKPEDRLVRFYSEDTTHTRLRERNRFPFRALPLRFELVRGRAFAEVLYPESVYDLVDFTLRESIRQNMRWRVCKNCGRYFALTGRSSAEYCDRPATASGSTCKDVGGTKTWQIKKKDDEAFTLYRREYKRRFAWIRLGKCSREDFAAWSEEAQQKKADFESGAMSLDDFAAWLKK